MLWLMLLAPLLGIAGYRAMRSEQRRWLATLCRIGAVVALAAAMARPMFSWHSDRKTIVAVVDVSPSAGPVAWAHSPTAAQPSAQAEDGGR